MKGGYGLELLSEFFSGASSNESSWVPESCDTIFLKNLYQGSFRHLDSKFLLNDIISEAASDILQSIIMHGNAILYLFTYF